MVTAMNRDLLVSDRQWQTFEPPSGYRAEVIQGEIILSPSPMHRHVNMQLRLLKALTPFVPDGYAPIFGLEWKALEDHGLVARASQPDLMVIPDDDEPVVEPPLLVIEVLSPSDRKLLEQSELRRIEGKRLDYQDGGLDHYLEVDLTASPMTIARFRLQENHAVPVEQRFSTIEADEPFFYELDLG